MHKLLSLTSKSNFHLPVSVCDLRGISKRSSGVLVPKAYLPLSFQFHKMALLCSSSPSTKPSLPPLLPSLCTLMQQTLSAQPQIHSRLAAPPATSIHSCTWPGVAGDASAHSHFPDLSILFQSPSHC